VAAPYLRRKGRRQAARSAASPIRNPEDLANKVRCDGQDSGILDARQ
jgi:hypothetical protein